MATTVPAAAVPKYQFDKAACAKKLDEVGKAVVVFKNRPGYDVDAWLKTHVYPLDVRLNVKRETSKELFDAVMALPNQPSPTVASKPVEKPATPPENKAAPTSPTPSKEEAKAKK